jgi:hypothetical protein
VGNDRFSRRGEPPTAYEIELLLGASLDVAWVDVGQELMRALGPQAGAHALAVVMDTVGTEKLHVPARVLFFQRLYRPVRDREVLRLAETEPLEVISLNAKVSRGRVRQILKRSGRRYRRKRVPSRA